MPSARNVALVFNTTFPTIYHCLCAFQKFCFMSAQWILLYLTMWSRCESAVTVSRASKFALIETQIALNQY